LPPPLLSIAYARHRKARSLPIERIRFRIGVTSSILTARCLGDHEMLKASLRIACVLSLLASPAVAQRGEGQYLESRYDYCRERARAFSGYEGRVPDRYLPGGALEGAARGSGAAGLGSLLSGDNRRERRRAERRGAIIGGIIGALRRGAAKKEQERKARTYRLELDACMRGAR